MYIEITLILVEFLFLAGLLLKFTRFNRPEVTPNTDTSVRNNIALAVNYKSGFEILREFPILHESYQSYPKRQKLSDTVELAFLASFFKVPYSKLVDFYWVAEQIRVAHPYGATPSHYHQGFQRAFGFPLPRAQQAPVFLGDVGFPLTTGLPPASKPVHCFIPHNPAPKVLVHKPTLSYALYLETLGIMATSGGDQQLFEEHFTITTYDQSKYDRVARIGASSQDNQTVMTLDINIELYPLAVGEVIHCVLASGLSLDGTKDEMSRGWRDIGGDQSGAGGIPSLADMFDYVCHGKIYKFEDGEDGQTIKCYISFGGLLMALEGPYKKLTPLRVDYVYLLIKKH